MNVKTPSAREQAASIEAFRTACEAARELLLPINAYNTTQQKGIIGEAIKGINFAALPYYSRAMNLLTGEVDRARIVHGDWVIKRLKNGQIRRRGADKCERILVDRT